MKQTVNIDLQKQKEAEHRKIVEEYFRLIGQQKFNEGLKFFAPDCKTHNPYFSGNMETLTNAMAKVSKEMTGKASNAEFAVKHILADGDLVAAYTQLIGNRLKPSEGGLRQVHLFRFESSKIAEYWDVTQQLTPEMPNAAGAF